MYGHQHILQASKRLPPITLTLYFSTRAYKHSLPTNQRSTHRQSAGSASQQWPTGPRSWMKILTWNLWSRLLSSFNQQVAWSSGASPACLCQIHRSLTMSSLTFVWKMNRTMITRDKSLDIYPSWPLQWGWTVVQSLISTASTFRSSTRYRGRTGSIRHASWIRLFLAARNAGRTHRWILWVISWKSITWWRAIVLEACETST